MNIIKKIFPLIILLLLTFSFNAKAGNEVYFNDTILKIGQEYELPMFFKGTPSIIDSIKIDFSYNSDMLDVYVVHYGIAPFMVASGNLDMSIEKDTLNPGISICHIKADSFNSRDSGEICSVFFRAKLGLITQCDVKILKFKIGNQETSDYQFKSARFKVEVPILNSNFQEGIGNNVPNPFTISTKFEFYLEGKSHPVFKIFNYGSGLASSIPDMPNDMGYNILKGDKSKIAFDNSTELESGKYYLELIPASLAFASGAYYIYMITPKSSYEVNFLYLK